MKVLGIDYGAKHIGLATGDMFLRVALPCGEVSSLDEVSELIAEEEIERIVLGLPLSLDRRETDQTREVRRFAQRITQELEFPVEFVDETYTSRGAGGEHDKAAAQILQTYFDSLDAI